MIKSKFALALTGVLIVLAGCDGPDTGNEMKKINGSVHVAAGTAPQAPPPAAQSPLPLTPDKVLAALEKGGAA